MNKTAETETQRACREWWTARLGASAVGWGRDKSGMYHAEFARNAEAVWITSTDQLRRQLAEAEQDAGRWRFFRERFTEPVQLHELARRLGVEDTHFDPSLDAAVDAARAQGEK